MLTIACGAHVGPSEVGPIEDGPVLASAVAAIAALLVARSAFSFQKNSLPKTASIKQIVKLLQLLYHFKSLAFQPVLSAADEDITGLGQMIAEAKQSVYRTEIK